ncbi:MAG TPA: SlyX family protein [Deltaproteobacteria bacterium]|nr:SlyX family protein [Deltaproteobacteria bacterium]
MSEERFTALETMVAYHEDTIQKLNDVVYKQQVLLDKLQDRIDVLTRLVLGSENPVADEGEK